MVESTQSNSTIADEASLKYIYDMRDSVFEKGGILIRLHISAVAHQPYNESDSFTDEPIGRIYCIPRYDTNNLTLSYFKW